MALDYLSDSELTDEVLNNRESQEFVYATNEAQKRDKNHPDNLVSRFEFLTNQSILEYVMVGWDIFKKHNNWEINKESYLRDLSLYIPQYKQIFSEIGDNLHIENKDTPTEWLVINGWPVEEMTHRIQDSVNIITKTNPKTIITTGGNTQTAQKLWINSEAEYLSNEIKKHWISNNIILEDKANNTGDNAQLVGELLWKSKRAKVVTTDYDSLRVALTNQAQMPFSGIKRTHGASFKAKDKIYWSKENWWESEDGWRATMYALSRLVNYRARTNPFL